MTQPTATQTRTTTWRLDPAHSSVEFSIKHMMMTTVRGRFKEAQARLTADEEHPQGCCVDAEIRVDSVDTGSPDRDAHLKGADFFDAERFPTISFHSTEVEGTVRKEGDRFRVPGSLTIRDATLDVVLDCVFEGRGTDPWGKERAGFSASTEIDRRDWGLRWNQAIETGGVLVANRVRIEVEVQFVKEE
ncbi:MAG TPA: YceI family protein [Gemmatimonadales bacterium]|jgi:polyisoprenoid-binding protein YceI